MNRIWGPAVTEVILLSCSLHRGPLLGVRKEKQDRPQSPQCWYSPEPPLEEANEKIKFTKIAMVVSDCNQSTQEAESGGQVQVHDQLDLYNPARKGNKTRPYLKNQIISKCMKFQKVFQRLCNIKVKKWITDMLKTTTTTKSYSRTNQAYCSDLVTFSSFSMNAWVLMVHCFLLHSHEDKRGTLYECV